MNVGASPCSFDVILFHLVVFFGTVVQYVYLALCVFVISVVCVILRGRCLSLIFFALLRFRILLDACALLLSLGACRCLQSNYPA